MRKIKVSVTLGYILLWLIAFPKESASAQSKPQNSSEVSKGGFTLKDGDRVVFLGNSLFENDFQYGYLELALTTRFPDRDVTFRNLGWTGDNVWGEARSTFTNPPTPYEHLMQDITKAQPTVVFLGYGGVEAQDGEAGLPHFKDGLNKLLDKIDALGARTILLSPIPVMVKDSSVNLAKRNADIELYASAIAKIASERGKQFIDIYKPVLEISKKAVITENGIHMNETGYYYLATVLENGLGLKSGKQETSIRVTKQGAVAAGNAKMLDSATDKMNLKFTIQEDYLPLTFPEGNNTINDQAHLLKISGLKKGVYTLRGDGYEIASASAKDWESGVAITQGPSFSQAASIREMILKKNELHFFQYRPLNQTYILGFRSYEQGRHVKGLEEQNILIKWLEGQIALHRRAKEHVYQLSPTP